MINDKYIITEELYLSLRSDLHNNGLIERYHQLKRGAQPFSHPDTRASLMGDEIEELERLYQLALKDKDIPRYCAYDRAITLVKNGVEKK